MKLFKVNISKSKLDTIPEIEKVFFVQLMQFINELNILQKCVIISSNELDFLNTIEKRGQISQTQFFIRTLAGKLSEGWKMINKNYIDTQLSNEYEDLLSRKGKDSLSRLKEYFNDRNNFVRLIRNKFAFHYDKEKIKEAINEIPQDEILEIYISEHRTNCLYSLSDTIVNWSILNSIDSSNSQRAMDKLINDIAIKVSSWFQEFCGDCACIIAKKLDIDSSEVEISELPSINEIKLPYFVKKAE
ncbi:MAG: hypothetical protein ACTSV5_03010 [Promethearchaeota archaeon]